MKSLVVGMGISGFSVAAYWSRAGYAVDAVDDRSSPPSARQFNQQLPTVRCYPGENFYQWTDQHYDAYTSVAISPGINPTLLSVVADKQVIDAALFSDVWQTLRPPDSTLLAVTGTNGKSTVVCLVAHLCQQGGLSAAAIGNVGKPMLEALMEWQRASFPAVVIVELSSFQLQLAEQFISDAAVVLNVGNDHLDRHGDQESYALIKRRIYQRTQRAIINRDDALASGDGKSLSTSATATIGYSTINEAAWTIQDGDIVGANQRYRFADMSAACQAQPSSVLAALALIEGLPLSPRHIAEGLAAFPGLPHRQRCIATIDDVRYIDDSKATNVDATLFGLSMVAGDIVLIAGGEGKGQDFSPLSQARQWVRQAVLIGRSTTAIQSVLESAGIVCQRAASLPTAVWQAQALAVPGSAVMLSPACASFDMFSDYRQRGMVFAEAVAALSPRRRG